MSPTVPISSQMQLTQINFYLLNLHFYKKFTNIKYRTKKKNRTIYQLRREYGVVNNKIDLITAESIGRSGICLSG